MPACCIIWKKESPWAPLRIRLAQMSFAHGASRTIAIFASLGPKGTTLPHGALIR